MTNCKNCSQPLDTNFCPNCGQPKSLKRIDIHYISHEIQHLIHFEKGIFYTIKELSLRPGKTIKEYITDNRNKLIKPIPFLIFTSLIYSVIAHYFRIEEDYTKTVDKLYGQSSVGAIMLWVQNHYGYASILMGGFIALWVKIFFKKYGYNIFEITVLLCFILGTSMLILTFGALFEGISHLSSLYTFTFFIAFAYICWAIGQFFEEKTAKNYIKAFFAYLLGYLSFEVALLAVGFTYDFLTK